jgi:hypothetical protein
MAKKHPRHAPNRQVFINVPFDHDYQPLFEVVVFAVMDCGFVPRCALEGQDSGEIRLDKLIRLIRECGHGIHDISRTELDPDHQLPRFNMPFELGLFLGAQRFRHYRKRCLILDRERFRYQKFLSDISGQDPRSHQNDPARAVEAVRDWLAEELHSVRMPGGREIYHRYLRFQQAYHGLCRELRLDHARFHFNDYCRVIREWLVQATSISDSARKPQAESVFRAGKSPRHLTK